MSLGARLKDKLGKVTSHLTSLEDQPLGKAALVVILFLDIFILVSIYNGREAHTRQLSSPDEYIPGTCREIVVNRQWNPTNRTDNLSEIIVAASTSYYRQEDEKRERHPVCVPYLDLFEQIKNDKALIALFEERTRAGREAGELQRQINSLKGAYDTALLESVAQGEAGATKVGATREEFRQKAAALDALQSRIVTLERTINGEAKIQQLWQRLQRLQEQDRQRLITDLRTLNYWHPVKRLGMQLLFLLPLFAVFYAWNGASIRRNRGVQTLVSSHLLGVSAIPILFTILETVYDIIPKKLLKRLMDLLESLKLVAVWHYLVIALAVAAALFLIYLFQKKLFSREKLLERRIARGECQGCGKRLPAGSMACPLCGYGQYTPCRACGKPRHVHGRYCRECGAAAGE
jgi:hypothetical protein